MKRILKKSSGWWFLLFFAGLGLYRGMVLAPIHEQCHAAAVFITGGVVTGLEHAYITWRGGNFVVIWFFGYAGEAILYAFLSVISRRLYGFWLGAIVLTVFRAIPSSDFAHLGISADYAMATIWVVAICVSLWGVIQRVGDLGEPSGSTPVARRSGRQSQ